MRSRGRVTYAVKGRGITCAIGQASNIRSGGGASHMQSVGGVSSGSFLCTDIRFIAEKRSHHIFSHSFSDQPHRSVSVKFC